jgi:hypothetical protein
MNKTWIKKEYVIQAFDKDNKGKIPKIGYTWWLRTPCVDKNSAAIVGNDGFVYNDGDRVYYGSFGVRPALWLKKE